MDLAAFGVLANFTFIGSVKPVKYKFVLISQDSDNFYRSSTYRLSSKKLCFKNSLPFGMVPLSLLIAISASTSLIKTNKSYTF